MPAGLALPGDRPVSSPGFFGPAILFIVLFLSSGYTPVPGHRKRNLWKLLEIGARTISRYMYRVESGGTDDVMCRATGEKRMEPPEDVRRQRSPRAGA